MKSQNRRFAGWSVLVGCVIVMFLVQSSIQSFAVYMPAIAGDTNWKIALVSLVSTTATAGAFLANLTIGSVIQKLGAKWMLCMGIAMYVLQAYLLSISKNLYMLWFAGFICGGAIAFGTVAPCSIVITNWFVKNRSQFIAIVVAASMFGSTVVNPAVGVLIAQFGWRMSYRIQATVVGMVAFVATIFLVVDTPKKRNQIPYGAMEASEQVHSLSLQGMDAATARQTPTYWFMLIGIFCIGLSTNIENYLPAFWQSRGISPVHASILMGTYAFLAAMLSLCMSKVNDKLGGKWFVGITSSLFIVSTLVMVLTEVTAIVPLLVLICIPFAIGSKKASGLLPPLLITQVFGRKFYASIIGIFTAMLQLGIAVSNPIIGVMVDIYPQNPYAPAFVMMASINFLGMALLLLALIRKPEI